MHGVRNPEPQVRPHQPTTEPAWATWSASVPRCTRRWEPCPTTAKSRKTKVWGDSCRMPCVDSISFDSGRCASASTRNTGR